MLTINGLRAAMILAGISLYNIYNHDFLSWDQGVVIFTIAFLGLTLTEILETVIIDALNQKSPRT
jgi:hypothetical protein